MQALMSECTGLLLIYLSNECAVLDHDAAWCVLLQEEAASVSQQREQLVLAEKLFGMDITGYPDLVQVCCRS